MPLSRCLLLRVRKTRLAHGGVVLVFSCSCVRPLVSRTKCVCVCARVWWRRCLAVRHAQNCKLRPSCTGAAGRGPHPLPVAFAGFGMGQRGRAERVPESRCQCRGIDSRDPRRRGPALSPLASDCCRLQGRASEDASDGPGLRSNESAVLADFCGFGCVEHNLPKVGFVNALFPQRLIVGVPSLRWQVLEGRRCRGGWQLAGHVGGVSAPLRGLLCGGCKGERPRPTGHQPRGVRDSGARDRSTAGGAR